MNTPIRLQTRFKKMLADTYTPVSMYLQVRDVFPNSILLESSDYHGSDNSCSYICCKPIAGFAVRKTLTNTNSEQTHYEFVSTVPNEQEHITPINERTDVLTKIAAFMEGVVTEPLPLPYLHDGLFGYMTYDAVQFFEDICLQALAPEHGEIPCIQYNLYQFVIVLNHFTNELHIIEQMPENAQEQGFSIEHIASLISRKTFATYHFETIGKESSNFTDEEFLNILTTTKEHIFRGDVFQIVLSRRFEQGFQGDDFNVYRALRSVNPSPYLFYFDYGSHRLFGSSPEAQIIINNGQAEIHPIAGTFRRTGDDATDARRAMELQNDPKENAEHVMLVDLARNDLSRHCSQVHVEVYKEIQYYSHVIHLVSKVIGTLEAPSNQTPSTKHQTPSTKHQTPSNQALSVIADTFPAGTLSGAPKYKAMELIDRYERGMRGFYGGAVGFMDFSGNVNLAIMIRSFMSKNNRLVYQAGAGLVADSLPKNEVQEVHNKLGALRKALELAQTL